MIDTKALRRLAQAATPGPWEISEDHRFPGVHAWGEVVFGGSFCDYSEPIKADQAFIAAANPAAISELIDRLEAAEKETASWKGLAKQFGNEADSLRLLVVMRFDHDHPPQFAQGYCTHELTEPVTAEHCRWFVAEIERLSAEVAHIKEVEFPRKAQAVADGWRGKLEAAEKERDDVAQQLVQSEQGKRKISEECDALSAELSKQQTLTVAAQHIAEVAQRRADALRAKIAEMERQEPVAWAATDETCRIVEALGFNQSRRFDTPLYALPGAKEQEPTRDWWDCLIADISAIDCMYRGGPTYAHDAYWMRDRVVWMLKKRRDALPGAQPAPSVPDGFAWPECPKRRQSHVLFDDGYEEGWAACVATIKAALAAPEAKP